MKKEFLDLRAYKCEYVTEIDCEIRLGRIIDLGYPNICLYGCSKDELNQCKKVYAGVNIWRYEDSGIPKSDNKDAKNTAFVIPHKYRDRVYTSFPNTFFCYELI